MSSKFGDPYSTTYASIFCFRRKSWEISHVDVGQNPVPPVNLKVDGHPLYQMISRFWPIPMFSPEVPIIFPWSSPFIDHLIEPR